jgi:alcohol dehydrogenase class IV
MEDGDWLIAVGGGLLIDQAKLARQETAGVKLAAIPTLWGSGAEFSPIAVWMEGGKKLFRRDPALLPDVAIYFPDFAKTLSPELMRWGCGDAWAHALEGFLSPLASDETRRGLASTLQGMLNLGVGNDPQWFELSALACAGQATSSVGLVHGMAHALEGVLGLGHARL